MNSGTVVLRHGTKGLLPIFDRTQLIQMRAHAARAGRLDLVTQIDELLDTPPTATELASAELHASLADFFCRLAGARV